MQIMSIVISLLVSLENSSIEGLCICLGGQLGEVKHAGQGSEKKSTCTLCSQACAMWFQNSDSAEYLLIHYSRQGVYIAVK